ncbi:MAG TPA: acyl-CoA dehydrogenase family protein, partial [Alphaproteobacteria bacterium]|nr:acyl-CoA dehydrogenase family protein [Alphaproteobacteria bacterium]
SFTAMARVMEELAAADLAFAFSLVVHNNLMGAIANAGSEAQRRRYLPAMTAFDAVGAFLLTEPKGGSDAAAIATTAQRDGGAWVIDGAKSWATNAALADVLSVYAQTDPAQGWRGIACFLIDADAPGVVREEAYAMLGGHAMGAGGFRFEGCRVEDSQMLVPPGQGFKAAMAGIDLARANVAAMCCGMLRSGLDTALAYISGREAFGQPLADFQGLQWQLADVATDLHAARLMAYEATRLLDAEGTAPLAAAHAKKFATRAALKGLAECMQALGANGLTHDYPLARHLAGAKIAQYLDGTTEIQNVVIARALLKPYREAGGA